MAGSSQLLRLLTIDKILAEGGRYSPEELRELCLQRAEGFISPDVKADTIRKDISKLRKAFGAPIPKRCKDRKYYYTDTSFSLLQNPIFAEDLKVLSEVQGLLKQFHGLSFSKHLQAVIDRFCEMLDTQPPEHSSRIRFQVNPQLSGLREYLSEIIPYVLNEQSARIYYLPFSYQTPKWLNISPYFLQEYNQRWYIVAWHHEKARVSLFAIDRIQGIKRSKQAFQANRNVNPETYFKDVVGVSIPREGQIEEVQLQIDNELYGYLKTKPLHASQKLSYGEKCSLLSLRVMPNYELKSRILAWAGSMRVVKPRWLAEEIAEQHRKALALYEEGVK